MTLNNTLCNLYKRAAVRCPLHTTTKKPKLSLVQSNPTDFIAPSPKNQYQKPNCSEFGENSWNSTTGRVIGCRVLQNSENAVSWGFWFFFRRSVLTWTPVRLLPLSLSLSLSLSLCLQPCPVRGRERTGIQRCHPSAHTPRPRILDPLTLALLTSLVCVCVLVQEEEFVATNVLDEKRENWDPGDNDYMSKFKLVEARPAGEAVQFYRNSLSNTNRTENDSLERASKV